MIGADKIPNDASIGRLLHAAQDAYGYLTPEVLENLASSTGARIADVLRIYGSLPHLQVHPSDRDTVLICTGKNCLDKGASRVAEKFGRGSRRVRCLGCCEQAPAIIKNGRVAKVPLQPARVV